MVVNSFFACVWDCWLLYTLPTLDIIYLFNFSHFFGCIVVVIVVSIYMSLFQVNSLNTFQMLITLMTSSSVSLNLVHFAIELLIWFVVMDLQFFIYSRCESFSRCMNNRYFPHSCLSNLFMISFGKLGFLILMESSQLIFSFIVSDFSILFKNSLPTSIIWGYFICIFVLKFYVVTFHINIFSKSKIDFCKWFWWGKD